MCYQKTIFLKFSVIVLLQTQFCKPEPSDDKSGLINFPADTFEVIVIGKEIKTLNKGDIKDSERLLDLTLCNNKIEDIELGAFQGLPNLERVNLSENALTKIPNGIFNTLKIRILDLTWNKLNFIEEEALNDMPELTSLYMGHNEINKWNPNWFQGTPKLLRLFFEHNNLVDLPENAFKNLESTKTDNKSDMCWFDFSNNQITELDPKAFDGVKYLEGINLKNNSITSLPPGLFSSIEKASLIWLWHNEINCVSDDFLESLPSTFANNIELDYNPWNCTCVEKIHDKSKKDNRKPLSITITYFSCVIDILGTEDD